MTSNSELAIKNISFLVKNGYVDNVIDKNTLSTLIWDFNHKLSLVSHLDRVAKNSLEFSIDLKVLFDKKDMVNFNITYEYDPFEQKLELKSIASRMGQLENMMIPKQKVSQPPPASKLYERLADKRFEKAREIQQDQINNIRGLRR